MGEVVTNELLAKQMQAGFGKIEAELAKIRAEQEALTHKVGTIASAMVSMTTRQDALDKSVEGLTTTTRLIAVSVDDHSHQLGAINTRLDGIEKKLDRTHA